MSLWTNTGHLKYWGDVTNLVFSSVDRGFHIRSWVFTWKLRWSGISICSDCYCWPCWTQILHLGKLYAETIRLNMQLTIVDESCDGIIGLLRILEPFLVWFSSGSVNLAHYKMKSLLEFKGLVQKSCISNTVWSFLLLV